jgi:hypothetical protein
VENHRHLQHLLCRFFRRSRTGTPQGSLLAFAPGDVTTRIRPITGRHSLFPTPIPAPPLVSLTTFLPSFREERYGLTTFHKVDRDGLGALCPPVALGVHDGVLARPRTSYGAFRQQASQHLWLAAFNDVYRWVDTRARSISGLFPWSPSEPDLILVASSGSPVSLSLQLWPIVMDVVMTSPAQWDAPALSRDHDLHPGRHLPFTLFVQVS